MLRNHKHLKPCHLTDPSINPSASMPLPLHTSTTPPEETNVVNTQTYINIIHENPTATAPAKTFRALKNIAD